LPCEVETVLRKRCQSCHSSHPASTAIVSLITYADLTAQSKADPSVTVAARSLKRIRDIESPMPPAPVSPPTAAEIAVLEAWVEAGKPPGSCDSRGEPSHDPYDAPPVCSSDNYWTGGTSGSPWMMPGRACIACHRTTNGHGPRFTVAGTVFPTAHEPDKCYGVPAATGAKVIITDANGLELPPIPVSAGGNFNVIWTSLAVPYRAKVVVGDSERVMLTPQTNGDCNGCHTQAGAEGARGRILLP
jgi:mono/diheme cytochrome c family protein